MSDFYRIKDLAPGLDGLVVECNPSRDGLNEVVSIYNTNVIFGDRAIRVAVEKDSLFIDISNLEICDNPNVEYSDDSPFGTYLYEGSYVKSNLSITYVMYDNALSVSILEKLKDGSMRTRYSQNFFQGKTYAMELIQAVLGGQLDVDDLVFELKNCKENEVYG